MIVQLTDTVPKMRFQDSLTFEQSKHAMLALVSHGSVDSSRQKDMVRVTMPESAPEHPPHHPQPFVYWLLSMMTLPSMLGTVHKEPKYFLCSFPLTP